MPALPLTPLALLLTLALTPLAAQQAAGPGGPAASDRQAAGAPADVGATARAPDPGELALAAKDRADHGDRVAAWQQLAAGVEELLRVGRWPDDRTAAEAEVAVLLLGQLSYRLDAWAEVLARLDDWRTRSTAAGDPAGDVVPWRVALHLDRLLARAYQGQGRWDEARGAIDRLGYVTNFKLIGPFDNERGGGFERVFPPEQAVVFEPMDHPGDDHDFGRVPGKVREVEWFQSPVPHHPMAWIRLDALLRPAKQGTAYLATMLQPDRARDVVLAFGSTGDAKVFLNGVELFGRQVERPVRPDQEAVVLPLQPGDNLLLIKLGVEDGPWVFEGRLIEPDGRPVIDLDIAQDAIGGPHAAPRLTDVAPPPRTDALLTAAGDAEGHRLAALYHLMVHPDDVVDRSAAAAARAALVLQPDDAATHYLLAQGSEPEGQSRHEMEVNTRLTALRRVLELDPGHVRALLDLADFALTTNPQPDRADQLTARAVAAAPDDYEALRTRAGFLRMRRREADAELYDQRAEACDEAGWRAAGLAARARRLGTHGLPDAELVLLEQALERDVSDGFVADRLIGLLFDRGREQQVVELTERIVRTHPYDTERLLKSARLLEYAERFGFRAYDFALWAMDICPEDAATRLEVARMEERLGHHEAVLEQLREVLRLDPGNERTRRRLALLSLDEVEAFEAPYRRDALELLGTPLPEGRGDALEVLDRTVVWRAHADGSEHVYEHVVWRPLGEGGIKQLDTVWIPAPSDARVQVFNVRVIRPDGRVERAPAPRRRDSGSRWFDLPPLDPGDLVDVEYRIDQSGPDVFGRYFGIRHGFYPDRIDATAPTRRSELVVLAPPELPLYAAGRNLEGVESSTRQTEGGLIERRWVARDLPRPTPQAGMPRPTEWAPLVDVTTYRDWNEFARWWWSFIQKEFVTTDAMRAKVAELTDGLATEAERVEAIARFVGQEIRYNAWPFGTHGYEPFSAATIFERRFGDCKDKSILLRQLLAEIDVEAIPVLINAEWFRADEPLAAAMVGQFNHCIAYLPPTDERSGYYLDATADHNPVEYLRADDQGARVLHVSPEGGTLHDIPYALPRENTLSRRYRVTLPEATDGGRAHVTLTDDSNGHFGVMLRSRFSGEQGDIADVLSRQLREPFGSVDVHAVSTSDLDDIGVPARLEAEFDAPAPWVAQGALRALPLGFDGLGLDGLAAETPQERRFELVLDRPYGQRTVVTWELPPGAEPVALPDDVRISSPGLLDYVLSVRATPEGLEVTREFELHERRIGLDRYADFRDALAAVRQAEARTILVDPAADVEAGR